MCKNLMSVLITNYSFLIGVCQLTEDVWGEPIETFISNLFTVSIARLPSKSFLDRRYLQFSRVKYGVEGLPELWYMSDIPKSK